MAAKPTRLIHKMAIELHLLARELIICSSRSRLPVRKLLDTPSYGSWSRENFVYIYCYFLLWYAYYNI